MENIWNITLPHGSTSLAPVCVVFIVDLELEGREDEEEAAESKLLTAGGVDRTGKCLLRCEVCSPALHWGLQTGSSVRVADLSQSGPRSQLELLRSLHEKRCEARGSVLWAWWSPPLHASTAHCVCLVQH